MNFTRSYPLEDIKVASTSDGRTVEAYAAVFDTPAEIRDRTGHYMETIARNAFDKTIRERGDRFGVFYHHGLTLHGSPSERGSVPIATSLEVRPDGRGVFTRSRYHKTPLAEEVLEAIREGSITGQSFGGRFIQSNPSRVPRRRAGGELPRVTRTEIAMREYGPTPIPAYEDAAIVGVRAVLDQARPALSAEQFARFEALFEELLRSGDTAAADQVAEEIETTAQTTPTTPTGAGGDTDTPDVGAVTDEPAAEGHSGPVLARAQARARLLKMGVLL